MLIAPLFFPTRERSCCCSFGATTPGGRSGVEAWGSSISLKCFAFSMEFALRLKYGVLTVVLGTCESRTAILLARPRQHGTGRFTPRRSTVLSYDWLCGVTGACRYVVLCNYCKIHAAEYFLPREKQFGGGGRRHKTPKEQTPQQHYVRINTHLGLRRRQSDSIPSLPCSSSASRHECLARWCCLHRIAAAVP